MRILVGVISLIWAFQANALLIDRGQGLIYDSVLDITWLQDGSYAQTTGYSDSQLLTWHDATSWVSNLSYAGYTDWRLPNMDLDGDRNIAYCSSSSEAECRDNELGYLAYQYDITPFTQGIFTNVTYNYWSSTDYDAEGRSCSGCAWRQGFSFDSHNYVRKSYHVGYGAWAVRDGDVASVPEPQTITILLLGLALLSHRKMVASTSKTT